MSSFVKIVIFSILLFPNLAFGNESDFRKSRCEHFIIQYHKDVDASYVRKVRDKSERLYRNITQEFNLIRDKLWTWDNRAKIFVAKDKDDYISDYSCPAWSGACVDYVNKIIYTYPDQKRFDSILAHELTHIIFREYVGNAQLELWLDEAIAVYVENKYGQDVNSYLLSHVKKALIRDQHIKFNDLRKITALTLDTSSQDRVSLFYAQSFSVVHFLIKRYGRDRFAYFLFFLKNGKNFESALSRGFASLSSADDLEKKWKKFYLE
ncbi:MAG: hypothetical protein GY858_07255 [Candidatus Omnitrophica bacterium]|nr:hypothetical protein [Candidatus Omnitrophota bacterium]